MMMHKALYSKDDRDRIYVSRKEGGRGLTNNEDNVDTSIRHLEDYIKKYKEMTDYKDEKQYEQYKDQQNNNN